MALEGTHIRIAADLRELVEVHELNKYISGTIYPDSRYVTKIERRKTHQYDRVSEFLKSQDDFKKGWAVHLLADTVQSLYFKKSYPELFASGDIDQGNELWQSITALKVIQDVQDVSDFNITEYLPCLLYIETPNEEPEAEVRKYNDIFVELYTGTSRTSLDSRHSMWSQLGVVDDILEKVRSKVDAYMSDDVVLAKLHGTYPFMIEEMSKMIREHLA